MSTENLVLEHGEYEIIEKHGTRLLLFKSGKVYKLSKCGYWKYVPNTKNLNTGYNIIGVGQTDNNNLKLYLRHRLLAYAFLNLDIENSKICIDHIDGDRLNNNINNLRIVNHQQNCFNRTTAKGYTYNRQTDKYIAYICRDYKTIYLGTYDTEEEAHQAYLQAKIIYHPIVNAIV